MRSPADQITALLKDREAARAIRDAAIAAAEAEYRRAWTPEAEQAIDLAAGLASLDERPPVLPRAPRKRRVKRDPIEVT